MADSVVEAPKSTPLLYASNCVGILAGLLSTAAGSAKMAGAMDEPIYKEMAPFWGVPGPLMKFMFVFELIGGFCLLGGLAVKSFAKLDERKANLLETLLLMDGVGLTAIFIGAQFFHIFTDGAPSPSILGLFFLGLRLVYNKRAPPAEFKMLFFAFLAVALIGLIGAFGLHVTMGKL